MGGGKSDKPIMRNTPSQVLKIASKHKAPLNRMVLHFCILVNLMSVNDRY